MLCNSRLFGSASSLGVDISVAVAVADVVLLVVVLLAVKAACWGSLAD